ncbi:MAG: choice-of-anchor E domain-containing protein [Limisphaerales bacterium]
MNKSIGILAGVLGMGLAFTAEAQTSGPFNTTTPIPATATDWNGTLVFPQFNSALGTLNSVELFFSSSTTTFLTVQNISNLFGVPSSSSGTAFSDVQLTSRMPGTT